jgi:hypothetical protein
MPPTGGIARRWPDLRERLASTESRPTPRGVTNNFRRKLFPKYQVPTLTQFPSEMVGVMSGWYFVFRLIRFILKASSTLTQTTAIVC